MKEQYLGNQMSATTGVYDYTNAVLGIELLDETYYKINLSKYTGWWAAYRALVIIQHRPTSITFNDDGALHNEDGPAISYRDDFGVYFWNGRRIEPEKEWIIHTPDKIGIESFTGERNTEIRRIMLEKMGSERFFAETNSEEIDYDHRNKVGLYELDSPLGSIQVTKSICHTTAREYVEFLGDNRFETVQEAMNWQFRIDDYNPEQQS
jgi:hypothetical protein